MNRQHFLGRANEAMAENLERNESTTFAAYRLVGAILLLGGAGYLLDRWMGTDPWLLLGGLMLGVCVGFAGLLKAVR